jgi:hypothetical protein
VAALNGLNGGFGINQGTPTGIDHNCADREHWKGICIEQMPGGRQQRTVEAQNVCSRHEFEGNIFIY